MSDAERRKGNLFISLLRRKPWVLPILIFLFFLLLFLFTSRYAERPPRIDSITPQIGLPGTVMVIKGRSFGPLRDNGEVSIAGIRPVSSSYIEWSEDRISVRIPEDVGSGMVFVSTRAGRSNTLLFTNKTHVPVLVSQTREPGQPHIEELSVQAGPVGTLLAIRGYNFGLERGLGKVLFSQVSQEDQIGDQDKILAQTIEASENDFDYESWNDLEIHVRVPDGASSGSVRVVSGKSISNGVYFEVTEESGTKLYTDKRGYQIQYSVEVSEGTGRIPNSLDLWLPHLTADLEQRNMEEVNDPPPLWINYKGVMRYRLENITPEYESILSQTFWFDRYALQTRINSQIIPPEYEKDRNLYKHYTAPDIFIPSSDPAIERAAVTAGRREKNPYIRARNIYNYLIRLITYDENSEYDDIPSLLDKKKADSYGYAMLYTALCRSAGIPARPVSGYLVYGNKEVFKHYWTEFYLERFGWVPADPALGDGLDLDGFSVPEDRQEYYFGNLDNQRITFSKGNILLKPLEPAGKTRRISGILALQNFHEESVALDEYSTFWRDIKIIDWW